MVMLATECELKPRLMAVLFDRVRCNIRLVQKDAVNGEEKEALLVV